MSPPPLQKRPFGISLLSILVLVGGLLDVLGGVVLLLARGDDEVLDTLDVDQGTLTTLAVVTIAFGVLAWVVGSALRSRANWARVAVGVLAAARALTVLIAVIAVDEVHWYDGFAPLVIYGLVAGYLFFDDDVQAYYRGG